MSEDWRNRVPSCLVDACDAATLDEAIHLAKIELDLIREGQDGTDPKHIRAIKRFIRESTPNNQT